MSLRAHDSPEVTQCELEALLTPPCKGGDSLFRDDTPSFNGFSDAQTSRFGSNGEARKCLFSGKRSADCNISDSPLRIQKKFKDGHTQVVRHDLQSSFHIFKAVETLESRNMIADGSRDYALPTIPGQQRDLRSISPEVMADVVSGHYNYVFSDVTIVDCRYPYEFEGGHIKGAVNLFTRDGVNALLHKPVSGDKRHVLIFHCEFSSERGPKMYRFLRSQDRELYKDQYPTLLFPEMYLLHGGYKAFFNKFKKLCDPEAYMPILHEDHVTDLRHFRVKSKSWTAGEKHFSSRRHRSRIGRHLSFGDNDAS
ncbi:M-phase inducer phosphatase 1-like [Dreissena polymorpha]|nr:M-phase inducer phosphatase 1-like [Dreissena polymorpha]